jgi:hypothetical protein
MLRKIIPYTDEQREFVKMCNGEAHPPNEIARTWKKYQINLMYEIAIKMDSTLGSADTKYTYSHVVTSFHNIAAQGHTKAMEWLQMEGIAFTPPNEPPLLNIARIYPKKYTGGDMMGLVISGSFGSGTRR